MSFIRSLIACGLLLAALLLAAQSSGPQKVNARPERQLARIATPVQPLEPEIVTTTTTEMAPESGTNPAPLPVERATEPSPVPLPPRAYSGDPASNRALGQTMAAARGWVGSEWACLDELWGVRESGWRTDAGNPSGSYGIPQALPGSKMGAGWESDPAVQIGWGLQYLADRYGSPCGGLAHSYASGWY